MYDLPTESSENINHYNQFRKKLLSDGYLMMQYSVYTRFCRNNAAVHKHVKRLEKSLPKKGHIRLLVITDNQYNKMKIYLKEPSTSEKITKMNFLYIVE